MNLKTKKTGKAVIGMLLVFLFTAADQFSKQLAVLHLKHAPAVPLLPGIFELSYLENRGAAFGILQGQRYLFLMMTLLATAALSYLYVGLPEKKRYFSLHCILIFLISGALGNFIDRFTKGYVVDFFYFKWIDFPVFNVADIYVTVSAGALVLLFCFFYTEEDMDLITGRLAIWRKRKGRDV